jgi:hypothetical protein
MTKIELANQMQASHFAHTLETYKPSKHCRNPERSIREALDRCRPVESEAQAEEVIGDWCRCEWDFDAEEVEQLLPQSDGIAQDDLKLSACHYVIDREDIDRIIEASRDLDDFTTRYFDDPTLAEHLRDWHDLR